MPLVTGAEPIGSIIPIGTSGLSMGYLLCDGSAVSRTVYATLFAEIGVSFGYGDQSTTFNLPDLRGQFIRGTSYGSSLDPDSAARVALIPGGATGNTVGSYQQSEVGQHNHILYTPSGWGGNNGGNRPYWDSGDSSYYQVAGQWTDTGDSGVSSEARPVNVYLNFLIKAY